MLTNGDFENGAAPWIQGVDDNNPAPVVTENGNTFYSINVTNPDPGAAFVVNLSQKLEITPEATYTLTFDAWSDTNRSIIAGIGLSGGDFSNTNEAVNITTTRDTYSVTLTATGFGDATSRVLFDLNAEAGLVNIDDVSLVLDNSGSGGGGGTCTPPAAGEFITDGGFEQNAGCWELINNGGTVTISTTVNNGGSNSGQIKTTPGSNPALKQERVGAGTITPNTTYVVQFDIQASTTDVPADGAVFQAFTFSEPAEGSTDPAVQHVLVTGDASFPTTWETRTYTFTTAASVDGGVSLLLELVCGGAGTCTGTINIDNVSITAQ